jgi:hypothetical protein
LPETEALVVSLDEYIRARYSLIAVQTYEEERFLRFMRALAQHERHRAKGLYVWSRPRGLRMVAGPGIGAEPRPIANCEDPLSVIEYIEQEVESGLFVLCDFSPYLLDYGAPKPELVRRLRELAWAMRSRPVTLIFVGGSPKFRISKKRSKCWICRCPKRPKRLRFSTAKSNASSPIPMQASNWIPTRAAI